MKTKLIKIYITDKGKGSIMIRATNANFRLKSEKYGKALSKNTNNELLGKAIKDVLKNCD
jgi:hypothetical protein